MPDLTSQKGSLTWMTRHPVAANLVMLTFILGGFLFLNTMKQEVFPDFLTDSVSISMTYAGADPEEIERSILLVIEDSLSGIEGIDEISSSAQEGFGTVIVDALTDTDIYLLAQDIQQEIDRITTFPEEAEEPSVKVMASKRKTAALVLYGQTEASVLHELAENFREQLLQAPNISQVELDGVRPLEISIAISQENLRRYQLTFNELAQRIRAASMDLPGGNIKTESGEILIRMDARKNTGHDFAKLPILTTKSGSQVLLGDIAQINDGYEDTDYTTHYNGDPAIMINVFRVGNQTPTGILDTVKAQIQQSQAQLPKGIYIEIRYDASKDYVERVDLLLRNSALGLTLVLITLALFLEIRLAFWVMMGIPIAFLGSFLFLPMLGVSLNMISLFAFIIALGIVVDDAIIIGEHVYHYRQEGYSPMNSAIQGVKDMATPVTFSILTNIATFMPLFFMPGQMGKIFVMIPTVVILVFILSLIESLFILPNHLAHLDNKPSTGLQGWLHEKQQRFSHSFRLWVAHRYGGLLDICLKYRYFTISLAFSFLIIILAYAGSGRMGLSLFPKTESDFAQASITLPFGTPVEKTQAVVDRLIQSAKQTASQIPNGEQLIRGIFSITAEKSSHKATVRAYLAPSEIRANIMSTDDFNDLWRTTSGEIAGVDSLIFESDSGGPGSGSAITIELTHRNIRILEQASQELYNALQDYPEAKDISNGMNLGKRQLDFKLLPAGENIGLNSLEVARQVRNAFYGAEVLRQQRGRNEIKVMLRLPESERSSAQAMRDFLVRTPNNTFVPLYEIVQVTPSRSFTEIKRRNGRRNVQVTANVEPKSQSIAIINALKTNTLPQLSEKYPNLQYSFEGKQAHISESLGSLKLSFVFAVLAIYAMLAIPFRSYTLPLIVIVSIPFGIIGALLGHIVMGLSLSILSMLGIVALSGIVVNDALVLVSHAVDLEKKGDLSPMQIIKAAGIQRFRPIILTTLTTFFGLAPMILETSRQARILIPMAVSIGFGILFASLITLVLIPAPYLVVDDCKRGWKYLRRKAG